MSLIVERIDVLIPFNVEEFLSKILYVARAVKTILIKRVTSENRKRFSVYRLRVCKCKNLSADEKKMDHQIQNNLQTSHAIAICIVFQKKYQKKSYEKKHLYLKHRKCLFFNYSSENVWSAPAPSGPPTPCNYGAAIIILLL